MHELPKDLSQSLRSYRGSIYGGSRRDADSADMDRDLEKGLGVPGTGPNATESSLIIHPTKSNQALSSTATQGRNDRAQRNPERQDQLLRFQEQRQSMQRPHVDTDIAPIGSSHTAQTAQTAQTPGKQSVIHAPAVKDVDPAADRLAENVTPLSAQNFYELMGMRPPLQGKEESRKNIAVPHGLFAQICERLQYTQRQYHMFSIAVYIFLVLQLMISAVFIILGALTQVDTHIVIAILGAVSTVIAGGLALMQGQGLPNRLRMSRDNFRSVVFAAEELYWDFRAGKPILYKDVEKIREDYLRVLEEQKRNHPDAWNSVTSHIAEGAAKTAGQAKKPG